MERITDTGPPDTKLARNVGTVLLF